VNRPAWDHREPNPRYEEFWRALCACRGEGGSAPGDGLVRELVGIENGSTEPAGLIVHIDAYGQVGFYTESELGGPVYVSREALKDALEGM
jgi:hypothetical protein